MPVAAGCGRRAGEPWVRGGPPVARAESCTHRFSTTARHPSRPHVQRTRRAGDPGQNKTELAVSDLDRDHCEVHELFKWFSSRRPRHLDGVPGFDDETHLASLDRAVSKRDEGEPNTATNLKDVTADEIARTSAYAQGMG